MPRHATCLLVVLSLLVVACDDGPSPINRRKIRECSDATTPEHRSWVLECIKNGNPMSHEEPEDLVDACARTGYALHCPLVVACYGDGRTRVPCPGEAW